MGDDYLEPAYEDSFYMEIKPAKPKKGCLIALGIVVLPYVLLGLGFMILTLLSVKTQTHTVALTEDVSIQVKLTLDKRGFLECYGFIHVYDQTKNQVFEMKFSNRDAFYGDYFHEGQGWKEVTFLKEKDGTRFYQAEWGLLTLQDGQVTVVERPVETLYKPNSRR